MCGEIQDERVHDALDQRHRDHVAVGDVRDLVRQDALDLLAAHALQQAGRDGHQAPALRGTGGEGVHLGRLVVADLGHRQVGLLRELPDLVVEPVEVGVAGAPVHEADAHRPLGHLARQQQRHERGAEAPHRADDEERALAARPGPALPAGPGRPARSRPSP